VWIPRGKGSDKEELQAFKETVQSIDGSIVATPAIQIGEQLKDGFLWILRVPTFKPFTKVLQAMSQAVPFARILEISGHKELQVRVTAGGKKDKLVNLEGLVQRLNMLTGCQVMFTFQLPQSSDIEKALKESEKKHEISLCVEVRFLLEVLRQCRVLDLTVYQVYDYWCG